MPPVGFEPMISVLERAKIVHALDRAATHTMSPTCKINYVQNNVLHNNII
jgi:hypothetical protein